MELLVLRVLREQLDPVVKMVVTEQPVKMDEMETREVVEMMVETVEMVKMELKVLMGVLDQVEIPDLLVVPVEVELPVKLEELELMVMMVKMAGLVLLERLIIIFITNYYNYI